VKMWCTHSLQYHQGTLGRTPGIRPTKIQVFLESLVALRTLRAASRIPCRVLARDLSRCLSSNVFITAFASAESHEQSCGNTGSDPMGADALAPQTRPAVNCVHQVLPDRGTHHDRCRVSAAPSNEILWDRLGYATEIFRSANGSFAHTQSRLFVQQSVRLCWTVAGELLRSSFCDLVVRSRACKA
jgi:hypothetical protein